MAKFIAKGTVLVEKKFELEVESSSKIAAKQELESQVKADGNLLKEVSFTEITEEVEEVAAITESLPVETGSSTPEEDFASEKTQEELKKEVFPIDLTDVKVEEDQSESEE